MEICYDIFKFIASVNLGANYPVALTLFTSATALLATFTAVFYKPLRNLDKTKILSALMALYFLCAAKMFCDYIFGFPISGSVITATLTLAAATLAEFCIFCSLKNRRKYKNKANNQLIGLDLPPNTNDTDSTFNDISQFNPFKRAEFLQTEKPFNESVLDFEINYSYLLKWVDELLLEKLDYDDEEFLKDFRNEIFKYALKKPSNFEINDFSAKLNVLVKLAAKYDKAEFDAV